MEKMPLVRRAALPRSLSQREREFTTGGFGYLRLSPSGTTGLRSILQRRYAAGFVHRPIRVVGHNGRAVVFWRWRQDVVLRALRTRLRQSPTARHQV